MENCLKGEEAVRANHQQQAETSTADSLPTFNTGAVYRQSSSYDLKTLFNINSAQVTKATEVKKKLKNGKLDSYISLDCQTQPDPSVWLSAARVLIQVLFIISSSRLSCCFLSSADEADRHCWRPQVHHRVEFRNSRSSARFLSRCDKYERKQRLEPKKIIHWLNK